MSRTSLALLFFFALPALAAAQKPAKVDTVSAFNPTTFFTTEEPLALTLTADFSALRKSKSTKQAFPATASVATANGDTLRVAASVAARGEFRRRTCAMPSLMVNFKTAGRTPLSALKKLKLVCGCNKGSAFEEFLLKEYLTYKIYNRLTPLSFRVRLANVTYVDAGGKSKPFTQYAFFIEDVDALAKRNDCIEYSMPAQRRVYTDRKQSALMTMFQFMIGNLDWSVPNLHNVKLLRAVNDSVALPLPVPYDFDFCGLVNCPYAFPQEQFEVTHVTERLYRGDPRNNNEVAELLVLFRDKQEEIFALIRNFSPLPLKERERMLSFLSEYYQTIADDGDVKAIFVDALRKN